MDFDSLLAQLHTKPWISRLQEILKTPKYKVIDSMAIQKKVIQYQNQTLNLSQSINVNNEVKDQWEF